MIEKSLYSRIAVGLAVVGAAASMIGLSYQLFLLQGWSPDILISIATALVGAGIAGFSSRISMLLKDVAAAPRVFVSYSSEMKDEADKIAFTLRKMGAHLWLDDERLPPGSDYTQLIQKALDDADVVLALVGRDPSKYQELEIGAALAANKKVIPVIVGDAPVPSSLGRLTYVDLRNNHAEKGLKELVEAVT
jgi:hypothetical protein